MVEDTEARLFAILEVTAIHSLSIIPSLCTLALLYIIFPLAIVDYTRADLDKDTMTMRSAINPITLVDVSIWVRHPTRSIKFLVLRESLVCRSILELNSADPLPDFHLSL